ncbi:sensor histidine kinase [Mucilaginibacter gilvus]|uniref:Sensor histidine kinase n=1 Tax=Mucilaginibacter gilvus TaxID=2305909 RepID=A0A444MQQ3_9SPHI|nr:histidine kinase [Mucilaginibacter gilvus]RWY53939.1 sensor histidine kinase [Mucilaginibacter gilvus]
MKQFLKNIFPAVYGLLNYFTIRLLQDTDSHSHFWRRPWQTTAIEMVMSMAIGYVVLLGVTKICRYSDSRQPNASLSTELVYVIILSLLVNNLLLVPIAAFTDDGLSLSDFAEINIIPLLYTALYYGMVRSRSYLKAYVAHQLLVEKLTNDQLETELKFLRAQYHPHFLFNALNTIYFQVDDDVPGAKKSIELLSELLRYQLYDRQHEVSIKQELEYLQNYILLQKVRASKKMVLHVDFDAALAEQQIYPLLFLPLVENAFKYVGGKYGISITAGSHADCILFKVENHLPEQYQPNNENSGIGIENLKRRLELLYPDGHNLTLDKQADKFTAILQINY